MPDHVIPPFTGPELCKLDATEVVALLKKGEGVAGRIAGRGV